MPAITIRRRVYYDDTDGGGLVYHTNYLKYMEHARSEFFNARGYAPWNVTRDFQVLFVVANLSIRYLAPARLGDLLEVEAEVKKLAGVTVNFRQRIWLFDELSGKRDTELANAKVRVVCLRTDNMKPTRIPVSIQESMLSER